MSSRALRRLQRQQEASSDAKAAVSSSDEGDELSLAPSSRNIFDMLGEDEETDHDSTSQSTDDEEARFGNDEVGGKVVARASKSISVRKKKSTSSKAKEKASMYRKPKSDDDFDNILATFGSTLAVSGQDNCPASPESHSTTFAKLTELLRVSIQHLDPVAELKKKIGSEEIVDQHDEGYGSLDVTKRLKQKMGKGCRKWRNQLIKPRPGWPPITAATVDIKLEQSFNSDALPCLYTLVPSNEYLRRFEEMAGLVDLGDIEGLGSFIHRYPLFVDGLLVFSDYLRMSSVAQASEFVELSIYILEKAMVSCSQFDLVGASCMRQRLPYESIENRRFHLGLFRHVQYLCRKGCYRTAFEMGKLLWSLDFDNDPLSSLLVIDYLAIQAGQLEWIERIYPTVEMEWWWLPNWPYSRCLGALLAENQAQAKDMLREAIQLWPQVIPALFEQLYSTIPYDIVKWDELFDDEGTLSRCDDYFGAVLDAAIKIYILRTLPLWKQANVSTWVKLSVIEIVNEMSSAKLAGTKPMATSRMNHLAVGKQSAKIDFVKSASVFRHGLLSDLPNLGIPLPTALSAGSIHSYDPLPPEELELFIGSDYSKGRTCRIS